MRIRSIPGRRRWLLGLGLACTAAMACATARPTAAPADRLLIRQVVLEGVTAFSQEEFLGYLAIGESSRFTWNKPVWYFDGRQPADARRIVSLYAANGYYQARVRGIAIESIGRQPGPVRIRITVDEGRPALVTTVDFRWRQPIEGRTMLESGCLLEVGRRFTVDGLNRCRDGLLAALHDRGHAGAEVIEAASVDIDTRSVRVDFDVTPGPVCSVGRVRIEGLVSLPGAPVEREVDFAAGQRYRPGLIREIEDRLYSLGVFQSVDARVNPSPDDPSHVDIIVTTVENRTRRLQIGAGLGFEPNRWEGRVSASYTDMNLFGSLTRFETLVRAGYAMLPVPWNVQTHSAVLTLEPSFRRKGLLERGLILTFAPSYELGVEEGYRFHSPGLRLGASRLLPGPSLAELSYTVDFFDFFSLSPAFSRNDTRLGRDFRDPYLLSHISAGYTLFLTDSISDPRNGVVAGAVYDLAGVFLGGHFNYHRISPTLRLYWTPVAWLQLAARIRTGLIFPLGAGGVPITEKYYLGGSDTVRGWGLKRIAPSIGECLDGVCERIPVGGSTEVLGNLELRFRVAGPLVLALFGDVGDVQAGTASYRPSEWNCSLGGGFRFVTPIGRLRFDAGYRVNEPGLFPGNPRWALHLALGETF